MYYQKNQRRPHQRRYYNNQHQSHDHSLCGHDHEHTLSNELWCHIPSSILSIGLSFLIMFVFGIILKASSIGNNTHETYHDMFHLFHYVHMMFAAIGATTMLYRCAPRSRIKGTMFAFIIPLIFCSLSDVVLPSAGAWLLGYNIPLHLCLFDPHDALTLCTFLAAGTVAGLGLVKGSKQTLKDVSTYMHFFHVFIGVIAALSYLIAHGIHEWTNMLALLIVVLFISVVIPCTLSDFIIPSWIGKLINQQNNVYETQHVSSNRYQGYSNRERDDRNQQN